MHMRALLLRKNYRTKLNHKQTCGVDIIIIGNCTVYIRPVYNVNDKKYN